MPSVHCGKELVGDEMKPGDMKEMLAEMGSTPESLKRDVLVLKEWINMEPHLPNITTDEHDKWLQLFLIASKNSMEKAKTRLDNYFSNRAAMGDLFHLPPPPKDRALVDEREFMLGGIWPKLLPGGYFLNLEKPVLPSDGGAWSRLDMAGHFQRSLLHTEAFLGSGTVNRGVVFVIDLQHVNLDVGTTFLSSIAAFRRLMACIQDAMPLRIRAIHVINASNPSLLRMVINAITPILKGKLAQRIFIHDDYKSLHEHVPPKCLPVEYEGTSTTTMESLTDHMCNFILSKSDWFLSRSWMRSDEDRRQVKKPSAELGMEGSFRKLTVD